MDLEPVHTIEDEEHEQSSPSDDDMSLVGQILKDRRGKSAVTNLSGGPNAASRY